MFKHVKLLSENEQKPSCTPLDIPAEAETRRATPTIGAAGGILFIYEEKEANERLPYGTNAICSRPFVSGRPMTRFIACTAWPAEPFTKLSSTTRITRRSGSLR